MVFSNRWRIKGTLIAKTPFHVGNGDTVTRDGLVDESSPYDPKPRVEISAVATDHLERAYIPGTTLKGNLRAWLRAYDISAATVAAVFGSETPGTPDAVGGKAEFWDAFAIGVPEPPPQVPYWCAQRLTGVATSVAIDRRTRTARPNKLYHEEFVPPGIRFEVTVSGQGMETDELALLLFALEGFNDLENPVTLGANTGDRQGHFTWRLQDIARLGTDDVVTWLQQQDQPAGYAALVSLPEAERTAMVTQALGTFQVRHRPVMTLRVEIHFNGPFLVNDPSRTKRGKGPSVVHDETPDHAPLRNDQGRVVLPARSIRGAIRSQAERIVRTLNSAGACAAVDPADACAPLYDIKQRASHLCLTCQLFGAPGWRAPVEFSDFCLAEGSPETNLCQQFLAIDRFTGGGASGLKFDAVAVYRPLLTGTMSVELHRVDPWALGLLALALRDLMEGDIPLGFGASKGYGACSASIREIRLASPASLPAELTAILSDYDAAKTDFSALPTSSRPPIEVECVLMELVKAFQTKVSSFERTNQDMGGQDALS